MATIVASDNRFPILRFTEEAAPATPPTGEVHLYAKADGLLYWKDDAGTEYPIDSGTAAGLTAHLGDTSDAHDASAISIVDAGAHFTGTDVEAALQELGAAGGGGATVDPVADQFGTPTTAFEFATTSLTGLQALGTATTEDADTTVPDHLYIAKAASGTPALTGRLATPPATPWTAIAKLTHHGLYQANYHRLGGLGIAEASPGKIEAIHIVENAGPFASVVAYTNPTTYSSTVGTDIKAPFVVPLYYAIVANSGTSFDYLYSHNGWVWTRRTAARNPGFTVARVGVMVDPENASFPAVGAFDYLRIWNSALTFLGA